MERQLFILREDHQHRTRHEFINSLTRSPANLNFSGVLRPLADKTALWKWVLKVQMVSLLHNHHIVHLTFTLKWQIEAKNCSVCSKEPPSHSPEYLTLIKTLIQTNPLSHRTVSLPLSPPRHWSSDSSYQCAHGSGLVKGSNHPGGSSPHQHDRFPSTHIPTKTQTHMRLFARLLITTRGLHLVAPQSHWNKTGQRMRFSYRAALCCCRWPRRNFWETLGNFKSHITKDGTSDGVSRVIDHVWEERKNCSGSK